SCASAAPGSTRARTSAAAATTRCSRRPTEPCGSVSAAGASSSTSFLPTRRSPNPERRGSAAMAQSSFVDEVQVNLRGGDGGAGVVSFRREAHVPRGGPDGGDGGAGGDVIVQADRNVASLLAFKDHPHRRATSGKHGSGRQKHGARGEDL